MANFVTFEGGDGSGKSTLIGRIEQHFTAKGVSFLSTREPGGTPLAEEVRDLLLKARAAPVTPLAELLLFEAARADHVEKVIRPALKSGTHVFCDRFTHSTLAFQGYARGLGPPLVKALNTAATGGLEPDAVVWLKLAPSQARDRMALRGDSNRIDGEKAAFHEVVFNAFEQLANDEGEHFIVLDASGTPDQVFAELLSHPLWRSLFEKGSRG